MVYRADKRAEVVNGLAEVRGFERPYVQTPPIRIRSHVGSIAHGFARIVLHTRVKFQFFFKNDTGHG
jgi:hypothetical protein